MSSEHSNCMKKGISVKNLDTEANPRDDFYRFATGGWRKAHPLEKEYASFGVFNLLAEEARDNVKELIANLGETPEAKVKGSIAQKIADLYALGMDTERLAREGNAPLKPILSRIEKYTSDKLAEYVAWLSLGIDSTFFSFGVGPDLGNSSKNILHISEAGLGLGDRDYYLERNENNDRILAAYRKYIADLMTLAGYSPEDAQRISDTVVKVETEMARHKKTREERRNPMLSYNINSLEGLEKDYPAVPWREIFRLTDLKGIGDINVSSPRFLTFINEYLPSLTEQEIKDMMAYGAVANSAGALGEAFYDVTFEMYDRVMSGTEEKRPLWKRAQGTVGSLFGEAIGQLYVGKYFPPQNKDYMLKLVENLRTSLKKHITELSWMEDATKEKALDKLASMNAKIGYPDKWKDYSEIEIDPSLSYMENLLRASEWFTRDNFSKLSKPVDRDEWHMYPQTVNAYYSPQMNEICFPAAILQPPFFNIEADDAVNYGGIGVVIGHEMTHGFDDSGRQLDKEGNLNNWWTEQDEKNFNALTAKLVEQFNAVEVAPGVTANGEYTLGENIADQGGLRIALTALSHVTPDLESDENGTDGFTPLQRFYLSYAGVWANNIRPEEVLVRTKTDPHSLAENRVNVTLRNIEPFFRAFNVTEEDKLYRPSSEQVVIW